MGLVAVLHGVLTYVGYRYLLNNINSKLVQCNYRRVEIREINEPLKPDCKYRTLFLNEFVNGIESRKVLNYLPDLIYQKIPYQDISNKSQTELPRNYWVEQCDTSVTVWKYKSTLGSRDQILKYIRFIYLTFTWIYFIFGLFIIELTKENSTKTILGSI